MYYEHLSEDLAKIIKENKRSTLSEYAFRDENALRRNPYRDQSSVIRPPFTRDTDKIMNCPYYNRYADKTQVFSLYKNDDITRRFLHVQLVSRIARTIGAVLNLNLDLIESIALGHDMGHPPFAHLGERYLDELLYANTGRHFNHNIQSVRVLDTIFPYNITFQTLDGIACHNGELELDEYRPKYEKTFKELDEEIEACYLDQKNIKKLVPSTLEACVVRISDIIAYLGKDRQDAQRAHLIAESSYDETPIGKYNSEVIHNLITNIVENSYGKPYIKMDSEHFEALKKLKAENYVHIYQDEAILSRIDSTVKPMMTEIYGSLLDDIKSGCKTSPFYESHVRFVNKAHYERTTPYVNGEPNQLVADFIASMTDDYFVELHHYMFPDSKYKMEYVGYFD